MGTGGGNTPMLLQAIGVDTYNQSVTGDKAKSLLAGHSDADGVPCVVLNDQGGDYIRIEQGDKSPTLRAQDHGHPPCVACNTSATPPPPRSVYSLTMGSYAEVETDKASTLMARDYKDPQSVCITGDYRIRRITPKECCRLQGMPDWWVDGIEHKDAPEYKMWGNGMALPCVLYVMEGIAKANKKDLLNEIGGTS